MLTRRRFLWLSVAHLGLGGLAADLYAAEHRRFGFAEVVDRARRLAGKPYQQPNLKLPKALADLDYDAYRRIVYWRSRALWAKDGLPFRVEFFHRGYLYDQRVLMNEVSDGRVRKIPFSTSMFQYGGKVSAKQIPPHAGFAGFRLLYPLNRPGKYDEVISFLGSSYFRALGKGQFYGASSRGLAIDTTASGHAEVFPFFREFWLERPDRTSKRCRFYALLDSPEVCGAYQFVVRPGEDTVVSIEARLFARESVQQLGMAPLGSMFLYGEDTPGRRKGRRPEVHDSDGLLMWHESGEWIWRPLTNPRRAKVNEFELGQMRGFGLMQRDRDAAHYHDEEAKYQRRPSVWVEPEQGWGKGSVVLLELPSKREGNDNIVAFWKPAVSMGKGERRTYAYRLHWRSSAPVWDTGGKVLSTTIDRHGREGATFHIVYIVPPSKFFGAGKTPRLVVTAIRGRVGHKAVHWNPRTGICHAIFSVTRHRTRTVELRSFLRRGEHTLTETWSYTWTDTGTT